MQVCQPTTPAQIFHLLRRQMLSPFRKPLIIFTPKSLLRHKEAVSPLADLTKGRYQNVIGEVDSSIKDNNVKRVLACSGRLYYDLVAARREQGRDDVAIVRLEQLYPFPHKAFTAELKRYENAKEVVWCQDEPQNQGPWFQIQHHLLENMEAGQKLAYAGRAASASPAVGYYSLHNAQQKQLLEDAFGSKLKGTVSTK
jgi:2-oxoglutarate dehydrogenase E1 component